MPSNLLCRIALLWLVGWASGSAADTYPSHPIRLVVPFPAGGGIDTVARILQPRLADALGQPVVVDDRPGAASIIGTDIVAKSPPNGYTLLLTLNAHVVNASLYKKLPYDPVADFVPVALVATTANVLVVNRDVKASNVKELIALAREHPGALNFGSAGVGSPFHLAGALFNVMADVNMVHVPYKGGPQATTDLLSGRIQVMFGNLINVLPYIKSGQLRALAVTSSKRLDAMPELPTIAESGVAGYEFVSWFGVLAPAGTPSEIVAVLDSALQRIAQLPAVRRQMSDQGAEMVSSTSEEFSRFLRDERTTWERVVKQTGMQPE